MDPGLKQRLVGAAVLIALAVIFLPMLVQGPAPDSGVSDLSLQVPDAPEGDYVTRDLPLVVPGATGGTGLLADDGGLAPMDPATVAPAVDAPHADAADLAQGPGAEPMPAEVPADVVEAPLPPPAAVEAPAAREPEVPSRPVAATEQPQPPKPTTPEAPRPEPVAAPPARLPAATAGGDYAVNFGAYATRGDAGTVVSRLRQENLPAYVEETKVGGRDAWRVRIGPYASRADAESARVRASGIGSRASASVVALDAAAPAPASAGASAPARAPATAAAAPAAAAGTGFAVQLGAFGNAAEATALRDRLRGAGIAAFTDTVPTEKGTLTRVKAGPVATRAEAEQLKARVKSSIGIDGLVRSHP